MPTAVSARAVSTGFIACFTVVTGLMSGPAASHLSVNANAKAGATSSATSSITSGAATSVHSCDQSVRPGTYTCFAIRRTDRPAVSAKTMRPANTAALTPDGYGPADLQSAYKLPSSTAGVGQTVYVVDAYNYPTAASDLAAYRAQFGLPACTVANGCFHQVNQNGTTSPLPANNASWAGEMALDLDMVSATCPNCHITLVEADDPSGNLFIAVKRATTMGAKLVSMSWGGADSSSDASLDAAYFAPTGIVYSVASGDSGFAAGPIYPATSNRVVAVGGTSLTPAGNARGWSESAWSDAGSGCSVAETRPAWQAGLTSCSRRGTTDVSAVADPHTGVAVYQTYGAGGWVVYGGTSAAAPIIAGVYALAGTPLASASPASFLYQHSGSLYDVASGNNGSCSPAVLCTSGPGWDGPTGLGTPDGLTAFQPGSRSTVAAGALPPNSATRPAAGSPGSVVPANGGLLPVTPAGVMPGHS
jgi:subtilase family serine protease